MPKFPMINLNCFTCSNQLHRRMFTYSIDSGIYSCDERAMVPATSFWYLKMNGCNSLNPLPVDPNNFFEVLRFETFLHRFKSFDSLSSYLKEKIILKNILVFRFH